MRITAKGQVTIPIHIRERTGLLPDTEVEFVLSGQRVYLRKAASRRRGRRVVETLRSRGTVRMTTDEIMTLTRGEE
ncbi:MAG TPA: AbrB/MazE/SpoVT family DNA-binding domain-containing protein [Planctomycetota bacterium]|nr:AbrB/MazE/SpoVT family DNA-binding domain-containing protein [Planctomycetota bacterium]HRR80417.1 AbrB/MazE/SpoVT family DNA-binding domain-containing protein [Planctomycetota bacterium]HRT96043.1 AbrB/MazE/SpoVT family DNA-binding domain-containing protein [Planctomycetota bacterium]